MRVSPQPALLPLAPALLAPSNAEDWPSLETSSPALRGLNGRGVMAQKSPFPRPVAQKLRQIWPRPCLTMNILTGAGERANQKHLLRLLWALGAAQPKRKWLSPEGDQQNSPLYRPRFLSISRRTTLISSSTSSLVSRPFRTNVRLTAFMSSHDLRSELSKREQMISYVFSGSLIYLKLGTLTISPFEMPQLGPGCHA